MRWCGVLSRARAPVRSRRHAVPLLERADECGGLGVSKAEAGLLDVVLGPGEQRGCERAARLVKERAERRRVIGQPPLQAADRDPELACDRRDVDVAALLELAAEHLRE